MDTVKTMMSRQSNKAHAGGLTTAAVASLVLMLARWNSWDITTEEAAAIAAIAFGLGHQAVYWIPNAPAPKPDEDDEITPEPMP